jgi:hypothetical protein
MNSRRFTVRTSRASDRKDSHLGAAGDCCAADFNLAYEAVCVALGVTNADIRRWAERATWKH